MCSSCVSFNVICVKFFNSSLCSMTRSAIRHPRYGVECYLYRRRPFSLIREEGRSVVNGKRYNQPRTPFYRNDSRGLSSMVEWYWKRLSAVLMSARPRSHFTTTELPKSIFWEAVWTRTLVLGFSISFLCFFPSNKLSHFYALFSPLSRQHFMHCEPAHRDDHSMLEATTGDGKPKLVSTMSLISSSPSRHDHKYYGSGDNQNCGGEMAFREQHSISEQLLKSHISSSHSGPVSESVFTSASSKPYDISVRALKGGRVTMEDEYIVADGGRFVAVFDGHGGGGVSQFLKNNLYDAVRRHLQEKYWEESDAVLHPVSVDVASSCDTGSKVEKEIHEAPSVFSHAAAIKAAFMEIEENVLADARLKYQGSTAVAVILHESYVRKSVDDGKSYPKHRTVLSANIGDSRAVLSRDGRAINLTRDHKPNDQQEKERILAMGETIQWDRLSKVYRVRNLSLSRAIGDKYAKPAVSADVEINHYPVVDQCDEFVLLASDGLWDVMSSEDAVAFVHETLERGLSNVHVAKDEMWNYKLVLRRNMAKYVAREALRRGSSDNISRVVDVTSTGAWNLEVVYS